MSIAFDRDINDVLAERSRDATDHLKDAFAPLNTGRKESFELTTLKCQAIVNTSLVRITGTLKLWIEAPLGDEVREVADKLHGLADLILGGAP